MLFCNEFINGTAQLIADDVAHLGSGDAGKVALITNDITPDPARVFTDFTLASGNGLNAKVLGAGSAQLLWDPVLGTWRFVVNEPAGGLNFICTAVADPVVTAYGYILYNNDDSALIAMAKFTSPIVFDHIGKGVLLSADVGGLATRFIGDDGTVVTPDVSASPPTV